MKELLKKKIQTRIIYPDPIHKMKAYKKDFKNKKFFKTEIKAKGIFSLPLYPELEIQKVKKICYNLKKILSKID